MNSFILIVIVFFGHPTELWFRDLAQCLSAAEKLTIPEKTKALCIENTSRKVFEVNK